MHISIYPRHFILKLPPSHVSIQYFGSEAGLSLWVCKSQIKCAGIRLGDSNIGGISHQILVDIEPLDLSHCVLVAWFQVLILDFQGHCHVVISRILNMPRFYVVVLVFCQVQPG